MCYVFCHGVATTTAPPPQHPRRTGTSLTAALLCSVTLIGCGQYQYCSRAGFVHETAAPIKFSHDDEAAIFLKNTYLYPVRDLFERGGHVARLIGNPLAAKNLTAAGRVPDSSFYSNRPIMDVPAEIIARGGNLGPPPPGPFNIVKIKRTGGSAGFFGTDANGCKYLIKLDDRNYPELGSAAAVIASRIYWALGYFVPETYLITVTGTGDERFDGRRAVASRFVPGQVLGMYKMDWVRDRREFRALKLVAAWVNDGDRSDNNNLAAVREGAIRFYILDFNSALGSWQGRAKEPWRGFRHRWDVGRQVTWALTAGVAGRDRGIEKGDINSNTLGYIALRFDPSRWRNTRPNTAFDRMTEEDGRWMAEKIGQFSRGQLQAIVNEGHLSDPADAERLVKVLEDRQKIIVDYYGDRQGKKSALVTEKARKGVLSAK